jgi:copper chaperone
MKTLKYKTNINCGGCVATVTPYLDKIKGIRSWKVATDTKDKILLVEGDDIEAQEVEDAVREAGFMIEKSKKGLFW